MAPVVAACMAAVAVLAICLVFIIRAFEHIFNIIHIRIHNGAVEFPFEIIWRMFAIKALNIS